MHTHKLPRHTNVLSVDVKPYLQKSFLNVLPTVLKPAIFQGPICQMNCFHLVDVPNIGTPEQISELK